MDKAIYSTAHRKIVAQLCKARLESGLQQSDVAKKLGKSQSYISKMESGQRRIDLVQLKTLAKIYRKDISEFL